MVSQKGGAGSRLLRNSRVILALAFRAEKAAVLRDCVKATLG